MGGILNQETNIELSKDYDSNLRVYGAVKNNIYYFFTKECNINNSKDWRTITYGYTQNEQREMQSFIEDTFIKIINDNIYTEMNELEKVLAIYKYFSGNIKYNYDWLYGLNMSDNKFLYPDIEIYEALKTGYGVCHTYTYLMEKLIVIMIDLKTLEM